MERGSQARFIPGESTGPFIEGIAVPDNPIIRRYGKVEVSVFDSRELAQIASLRVIASQKEFYNKNPHLQGEEAYYSWLAQTSHY